MKQFVRALKALSDDTRLKIFKLIVDKPDICVCEIMEVLRMTQTRVSRNLAILKNAELVEPRRDGHWIHYSIIKSNPSTVEIIMAVKKHVKI